MALSGMTGFARVEGARGDWAWAVEARSVNGRNLEARYKGPGGFESLERAVREGAQQRFHRGQVNVSLQARRAEASGKLRINVAELERLIEASRPYVMSGAVAPPRFDGLLALRGVIEAAEEDEETAETRGAAEQAMARSIAEALDGLLASRREEGAALTPVLVGLVDRIEALRTAAQAEVEGLPAALKTRFARRITELVGDGSDLEQRIVQEAALLAVKADVREELDRLAAHVAGARGLIAGDAVAGRRLDFLTQEFMREANTLCSKSATTALTSIGLELKAAIEQLREQVQNVE